MIFAAGSLIAGAATAGELSSYPPPDSGPFYAPTSMHAAHVELGLGGATDGNSSITQIDGVGRLAGPLQDWLKGEVEVSGAAYFIGSNTIGLVGVVGHLYKETPTHVYGAFAGASRLDNVDLFTAGGEVKGYFGQSALTGQVAYITAQGNDAYMASGRADHYFTPDNKGSAMLVYYTSSSSNVWIAGLGFEKRITGTDWGMAALGSYVAASGADGIWTGRVALKKYFDAPGMTLQQHDRMVPFVANSIATLGR